MQQTSCEFHPPDYPCKMNATYVVTSLNVKRFLCKKHQELFTKTLNDVNILVEVKALHIPNRIYNHFLG